MTAKRLTWADVKNSEAYSLERQSFTDEHAQQLGYPSAEVLRLYDHLSSLASEWRGTKSRIVAQEYGKTLLEMVHKGYDLDHLPIQDQLPAELMPEIPLQD